MSRKTEFSKSQIRSLSQITRTLKEVTMEGSLEVGLEVSYQKDILAAKRICLGKIRKPAPDAAKPANTEGKV